MKTHLGDDDFDIAAINIQRENEALETEIDVRRRQIENLRTHLSNETHVGHRLNIRFRIIRRNLDRSIELLKDMSRKFAWAQEDYTERSLEYYCKIMELETRVLLWQAVSAVLMIGITKKFLLG